MEEEKGFWFFRVKSNLGGCGNESDRIDHRREVLFRLRRGTMRRDPTPARRSVRSKVWARAKGKRARAKGKRAR